MRIHQSLRVTPAMEAGVTNHLWNWKDFINPSSFETSCIKTMCPAGVNYWHIV